VRTFVCICTCDRAPLLRELLQHIKDFGLDSPSLGEVAVIVVDNNPTGEAEAVCREAALPVGVHFIEEPRRGIPFARNTIVGEALARGADFIAFIDDDDLPEPDWLTRLLERQSETDADIVCGAILGAVPDGTPEWLSSFPLFHKVSNRGTSNVLIRRGVFERIGMFDTTWMGGEDGELFQRAVSDGLLLVDGERSRVNRRFTGERETLAGLMRRSFARGAHTAVLKSHQHSIVEMRFLAARRMLQIAFLEIPQILFAIACVSRGRVAWRLHEIARRVGWLYGWVGGTIEYR